MSFSDLPPEVKLLIFEIYPENLRLAQGINASLRQLTRESEMRKYLKTHPTVFGVWNLSDPKDIYFTLNFGLAANQSIKLSSHLAIDEDDNLHLMTIPTYNGEDRVRHLLCKPLDHNFEGLVDMWTYYQIILRRIHPTESTRKSFAAKRILSILDQYYMYRSYRSARDLHRILSIYLILLSNAIILRIPTLPDFIEATFHVDSDGIYSSEYPIGSEEQQKEVKVLTDIRTSIETMYREIRQHFEALL
jgi:hypothetical protein